jgi:hypothetical protein
MKTLTQIINSYKNDWHKVDWLFLWDVQSLSFEEIIEIIKNAKGRDIVVEKQDNDMFDWQWFKYKVKIDPNFDINKYL